MIRLLRRLVHPLTHHDEYHVHRDGTVHEYCYRRWSGRLVGEKVSKPGDRPNFQPVTGGAK